MVKRIAAAWWVSLLAAPGAGQQLAVPTLAADQPFPAIGTSVTLSVQADPGAQWGLWIADAPARLSLGTTGTLFLQPGRMAQLAGGVMPAGGAAQFVVAIPQVAAFAGTELFVQASAAALPLVRLSARSIALRLEAVPRTGARRPLSVAATPTGNRAYVASSEDGTIDVLDPAANRVVCTLPGGPSAGNLPFGPVHVAVDPEGRHAFALNAAGTAIRVIDTVADTVVERISVPRGCIRIAFSFSASRDLIYVTNEVRDEVLVFEEAPRGRFSVLPVLPLLGRRPGPVVVLPDGRLVVGDLGSRELELLDRGRPAGQTTVARLPLGRLPFDVLIDGDELLVPCFTFGSPAPPDGDNEVIRVKIKSFRVIGALWQNAGTDYRDVTVAGPWLAVTASGSGALLIADRATRGLPTRVDLAPGAPVAAPRQAAYVAGVDVLYVVNTVRETIRPVSLATKPPFQLAPEIALGHSGRPRIPLADLTAEEDGRWLFSSVAFFNGTAQNPNPVTCATCHPDGGADGLNHNTNTPGLFRTGLAPPFSWGGSVPALSSIVIASFLRHGVVGGTLSTTAAQRLEMFLTNGAAPPPSPFRALDGSLTPAAQAGKALFDGKAQCASCHAPPLFIPIAVTGRNIVAGVGTGLAPANVPSLLGLWSTAPYLHDGSANSLLDVLQQNPGDQHGTTSTLTASELADLVEYLRSL